MPLKKAWQRLSSTYKILIAMLLFIMFIQLSTLVYIWKFQSNILLEKERTNLSYELNINAKLLLNHMKRLQQELKFLASLEVMDDILVNDIDKRITVLLVKKAKDLSEGIVFLAIKSNEVMASSRKEYKLENFLKFEVPIDASFNEHKEIGILVLLFPKKNLMQLQVDNPHQRLWLKSLNEKMSSKNLLLQENIVVSKKLSGVLKEWKLFLSYEKEYALQNMKKVEQILLFAFFLSLLALLFVVWIFSKKQINILEHTQEILELKRTFLSTMSHELRTPLGSILNLTQHLMVNPKMGDEEIEVLVRIENSSEHLLGMINNLLQLSKLESNAMSINKESVNVLELLEEMIEIVEPLIEEKGLKLVRLFLKKEITITTDVHLFKQIVINLLSNAIKFTEKGSISIELTETSNRFKLSVIDTGIGIDEVKQTSLFSEFYQAHTGSKEIKHSTGLGLALSQKVAKLLNGHISISSKGLEAGTSASFIFSSL